MFKYQKNEIYIKLLSEEDVTKEYVDWMNNSEITKFLESRWSSFTLSDLKQFVSSMNSSQNNYFFGIYDKNNNKHIGNIKLGNINWIHKYADIGLIIGLKEYWGKGIATSAIHLAVEYAFNELKLHKVFACAYEDNIGSKHAFLKNGFIEMGIFHEHVLLDGSYQNLHFFEKINS